MTIEQLRDWHKQKMMTAKRASNDRRATRWSRQDHDAAVEFHSAACELLDKLIKGELA